jgi:hypothetical protein
MGAAGTLMTMDVLQTLTTGHKIALWGGLQQSLPDQNSLVILSWMGWKQVTLTTGLFRLRGEWNYSKKAKYFQALICVPRRSPKGS